MRRHHHYVMQDQVRDRVRSIMNHTRAHARRRPGLDAPARWLALLAAAAYTAALAVSR